MIYTIIAKVYTYKKEVIELTNFLSEKEDKIINLENEIIRLNVEKESLLKEKVEEKKNTIPERTKQSVSRGNYTRTDNTSSLSDEDLIARLVWLEARGEPDEGQQAVAECIMNRVKSTHHSFPNTVSEVIFRKNQFTPASQIATVTATEKEYRNVRLVLSGQTKILPNENYVYFGTGKFNGKNFIKIGNHWFSSYK